MTDEDERRNRYATAFGAALTEQLAGRRMLQADLAKQLGRSAAYTNQVMTGRKKASPEWVDLIAGSLNLTDAERQRLHVAAATDHGFKLDLTKK